MKAIKRETGEVVEIVGNRNVFIGNHGEILSFEEVAFLPDENFALLPAILWTGKNLKDVIEFTGVVDKFDQWFNSWEEYENYVRSHDNIFKIFSSDGHWKLKPGTWIVKTPDGFNIPLGGDYERG